MIGYLYIFGTILFTVYGQLIIKWRMNILGQLPVGSSQKILFLLNALLDPFIISGFLSAFFAALSWMAAMTKFEISTAYPFMSLSFIMVLFLSCFWLGETITIGKILGLILIIFGLIVTVKY